MHELPGWLLLILSAVGHTEWWIIAVNRTHALPVVARKLRMFRAVHDVAVLAYPPFLLWQVGLGSSGLLRSGWSEQSPWVQWMLLLTISGCIPLMISICRWQLFRRREFHLCDHCERHDVMQTATDKNSAAAVKGGRRHPSQLWPWNEIYHLEVNTKSVVVPRGDGMPSDTRRPLKIVHFTDCHFIGCPGLDYYRFLIARAGELKADAYVFTGDLIDEMSLLEDAVEILRPLTAIAPCFFILGNHDWKYDFEHIRRTMMASGWRCVTGQHELLTIAGRRVLLAGSELPWMGSAPPAVRDAGCDVRILLSHSPDQYRFAQRCGYDLMLSGHTHGGQVVLPLIGPVYSPSLYGVSFVSGLFQLGKLTMHVSRGIGAKDPMRWRCSPELTCLEIHC